MNCRIHWAFVVLSTLCGVSGCRHETTLGSQASERVLNLDPASPRPLIDVHFGHVGAGESVTTSLLVANTSGGTMRIVRMDSTCDCISLDSPTLPLTLPPRGTKELRIKCDLAEDSEFSGSLGVFSSLYCADGALCGRFRSRISVRK